MTHPAHSLKMIAFTLEVDELAVERPGERDIQSWIAGNLAGQHDALANNNLHVSGPQGDSGGLWPDNRRQCTHVNVSATGTFNTTMTATTTILLPFTTKLSRHHYTSHGCVLILILISS